MSFARIARTPLVAGALLVMASLVYAVIPSLNYYARGWESPLLLTGVMRLGFSAGVLALLLARYRPLSGRRGLRVTTLAMGQEWKLLGLAMLTTGDVALFSLSYRFVDVSVTTAMTAMVPAANVVLLTMLNRDRLNGRQAVGLLVAALGMALVMWAAGAIIDVSGQWWLVGVGIALGLAMIVCNGLTVAALRLGEVLALEWYWQGLGRGADLVWCGSMLTLALAQGITAPVFLVLGWRAGEVVQPGTLALMILMGLTVWLGTALWALANGAGLRPTANALGYLQPGWAVLILAVLGIAGSVAWPALVAGLAIIVAANIAMERGGKNG